MGRIAPLLALALLAAVLVSAARGGRSLSVVTRNNPLESTRSYLPPLFAAYRRPAHYQGWLCVHGKEAAWNDPDAPYFGGLQMGYWFMHTYAARMLRLRGTAEHWTPLEQMRVAERAWAHEGYSVSWLRGQWPTSYGCL